MISKFTTLRQLASMTAILAVMIFAVGPASAGTQRPMWKDRTPSSPPPSQGTDDGGNDDINPVNGDDGYEGEGSGDDGYEGDDGGGQGQMTGGGSDDDGGTNAVSAPTPSAVAGGLAMLGLMAGRRRRQA